MVVFKLDDLTKRFDLARQIIHPRVEFAIRALGPVNIFSSQCKLCRHRAIRCTACAAIGTGTLTRVVSITIFCRHQSQLTLVVITTTRLLALRLPAGGIQLSDRRTTATGAKIIILNTHRIYRGYLSFTLNLFFIRNAKHITRFEQIDIVVNEGIRIGSLQGQHGLLNTDPAIRAHFKRNLPQRIVDAGHTIFTVVNTSTLYLCRVNWLACWSWGC